MSAKQKRATPKWKRNSLNTAVALAISSLSAMPSWSAPCVDPIDTTITGGCDASGVTSLAITSSGAVSISSNMALLYTGDLSGILTNNGQIVAGTASASFARGVSIAANLSGTLSNTGTISATARSASASANAAGVYVEGGLSGTLSNSGTISASASTTNNFNAFVEGVYVGGGLTGTLSNSSSGTISASAITTYASASANAIATGINVANSISSTGILTNSGRISAFASATNSEAGAKGVTVDGDLAGTLGNGSSGTISATAISTYATANANGIYVNGTISGTGTLTNSGTISATAEGNSSSGAINADGVFVSGAMAGNLTNSGSISATAMNLGTYVAYAYGVLVGGDLTGTLSNSSTGIISATASATYNANAYGVFVNGAISGAVTNSGTIEGAASGHGNAYADGLYVGGDLTGTLNNSSTGTISATANASYNASAHGIYVSGSISGTGTLTNSGTIEATATGQSSATATGVYVVGNLDGRLSNSGSISANASATNSGARAEGVHVGGDLTGTLSNGSSGTIRASAISTYAANATGVYAGSVSGTGILTNSGSISATAEGNSSSGGVYAYGVYVNGTMAGNLTNSGTIEARASSLGNAYAQGVYVGGNLDGTLSNSSTGTISVTANATYVNASAIGVNVSAISSTGILTNSGTIRATANATSNANAFGVYVGNLSGTLTNSGAISGLAFENGVQNGAHGYSIYAVSGTGGINNLEGGELNGNLYAGGSINVANAGKIFIPAGAGASVGGSYAQSATGTLGFGARSTSEYGSLAVGGTADLAAANNTIYVRPTLHNTLHAGDVLNDVVSAGTLTLAAGNAINVISTPLASFTGVVDGSTIDLTVASVSTLSGVYGQLGSLGSLLDTCADPANSALPACANSYVTNLINTLPGLTTAGQMNGAMQDLQPLMAGGMEQVTADVLRDINRSIRARQDVNRGMASGDSFSTNRNGWVKLLGSRADQDDNGLVRGYKADTYGLVAGADGELSPTSRVGVAFAYSNTRVDSNGSHQSAKMDSYLLAGYGSKSLDTSNSLDWQVDYSYNRNKGDRHIDFLNQSASASYNSSSFHLGAGLGHSIPMSNPATVFVPTIRVDFTNIREDGFTDSLGNTIDSRTTNEFVIGVDGKVSHALSETTKLIANLGLDYNTRNNQSSINMNFPGGGASFAAQGINPSRTTFVGGLGVVVNTSKAMEVTARYDFATRSGYTDQTASIKLKVPF